MRGTFYKDVSNWKALLTMVSPESSDADLDGKKRYLKFSQK